MPMSRPINNLEDVLRWSATPSTSTTIASSSVPSTGIPKTKFKPALLNRTSVSLAAVTAQPHANTALASFSTPGFGRPKLQDEACPPTLDADRTYEIIISSPETSPSHGFSKNKRPSSDYHHNSNSTSSSPPSKRARKILRGLNKENNDLHLSPKSEKPRRLRIYANLQTNPNDDQFRTLPLNHNSQPPEKDPMTSHNGRNLHVLGDDKSSIYLVHCHSLHRMVSEQISQYRNGVDLNKDIQVLEDISILLENRIKTLRANITEFNDQYSNDDLNKHDSNPVLSVDIGIDHLPPMITQRKGDSITHLLTSDLDEIRNEDGNRGSVKSFSKDKYAHEPFPGINTASAVAVRPEEETAADLTKTSFYPEVMQQLASVFKLPSFRKNQLEAITAAMNGRDVFVLMPTGGGKSLCYQLPAVCASGKTKGVTVVVSPLLALMKDQVVSLLKKQIDAFLWNSETSQEDVKARMFGNGPKPSLLYVTPEKLKDSNALKNILFNLYRSSNLARFVIDEAHCISSWGQDFRAAYSWLGHLRDDYPTVPIMALTATANLTTINDITKQLRLRDYAFFNQSYNRTNLRYTIKSKRGSIIGEISEYIRLEHPNHAGIIYCIGRDACEKVARQLNANGLRAAHYHAKMPTTEKDSATSKWQAGEVNIIVATIAFGMGIDKANVRFVIHHDLARSISGYYQETGRAGRDGEPADCILYYSYSDFEKIRRLISNDRDREEKLSPEAIQRQENDARQVVNYCQNITVCRRVQLLQFFGEKFDKANCNEGCDNCIDGREPVQQDVTNAARSAIAIIRSLNDGHENVTITHLQAILKGANSKDIRKKQHDKHPHYGAAKEMQRDLLEQMLRRLQFIDVLSEISVPNASNYYNQYITLGPNADTFLANKQILKLDWRPPLCFPKKKGKNLPSGSSNSFSSQSLKGKQRADGLQEQIELYDSEEGFQFEEPELEDAIEITEDVVKVYGETVNRQETNSLSTNFSSRNNYSTKDSAIILYNNMTSLCRELMAEEKLASPQDVLRDDVLQLLSATCPQDYAALKKILKESLEGTMSKVEADSYVEQKFEKYGRKILNLCMSHKLNTKHCAEDASSKLELPKPSALAIASHYSSARKIKFRPQT